MATQPGDPGMVDYSGVRTHDFGDESNVLLLHYTIG